MAVAIAARSSAVTPFRLIAILDPMTPPASRSNSKIFGGFTPSLMVM